MSKNEDKKKLQVANDDNIEDLQRDLPIKISNNMPIGDEHSPNHQTNGQQSIPPKNIIPPKNKITCFTCKQIFQVLSLILLIISSFAPLVYCFVEKKFSTFNKYFQPVNLHFQINFQMFISIWALICSNKL
jgi:hypothetical protein